MREIKFELVGKNMSGKILREVYTLEELMDSSWQESYSAEIIAKRPFTGLKYKDVEIYKGDIFNFKRDSRHPEGGYVAGTYGYHPDSAEVVNFEDGCFFAGNDYLHNRLFWYERHNWQLIGNIYENLDLLSS